MTLFQGPASVRKSVDDFLGSGQNDTAVREMFAKVTPLLADGEQVEHILVQRMTGLKFPGALVLTNRRALLLGQGLLRLSFRDLFWRDLSDAHMVEGWLWATVGFQGTDGAILSMDHLPKEPSRKAYAYAQAVEELALEYRRHRALEESRAAARGVPVERYPERPPLAAVAPTPTPSESLAQLKDMLDRGLLSEPEYEAKKREILSRL